MSDASLIEVIVMTFMTGALGYIGWSMRQLVMKVDDHEKRLVKVETILDILGDIREDIGTIKTDVEVLKSRM